MRTHAKSNDGRIHLISAVNGEFTLCGDAFDGDADHDHRSDKIDPTAWTAIEPKPITCEQCIAEINNCRQRLRFGKAIPRP